MSRHRISWLLYIVGSLLVFGSWVDLVPVWLSWIGWLMAICGWAIGNTEKRQVIVTPSRTDELAKLDLLRKEGVVTEDEFQREKQRILRQP